MEIILVLVGGYYLWGNDGFLFESETACGAAVEQAQVCVEQGKQDARERANAELARIIGDLQNTQ